MHHIYKYLLFLVVLCCVTVLSVQAQDAKRKFVLVIDAGHGGHDPGAVGKFAKEKTINLNVALQFGKLVKENCPDVKVIYTRSKDVFIPLQERANIANRNKADLFVSIHTNAAPKGSSAYGAETYTLGIARASANLEVAKRENAVITYEKNYQQTYEGFDPNKVESYIIFELMQDRYMQQSVELAKMVQQQFTKHAGRRNKGVHQAGFLVLRQTSMPSVLTELGFISNPNEEAFLASQDGVNVMGQSLYNAFVNYRKKQSATYQAPLLTEKVVPQKTEQPVAVKTETKDTIPAMKLTSAQDVPSVRKVSTEPRNTEPQEATAVATVNQVDASRPVFKWQITVMGKCVSADSPLFKGLKGVENYYEDGMYKYTYGASNDFNAIKKMQAQVKEKFPQAFMVAFIDGKRANLFTAKQMAAQKK